MRWQLEDLLSGASDLAIYEYAKQNGWSLYINKDLHAKAILVDDAIIFLGSANVTGKGLSLVQKCNIEFGTSFTPTEQDIVIYRGILNESVLVTQDLYEKIKKHVESLPDYKRPNICKAWPHDILSSFENLPKKLWVTDNFWTSFDYAENNIKKGSVYSKELKHDLDMLGLHDLENIEVSILRGRFLSSRAWRWIYNKVCSSANYELYFGELSVMLHESLYDDPTPYRREVKELLQNMFTWADVCAKEIVEISVPGRKSQRIKLRKKP